MTFCWNSKLLVVSGSGRSTSSKVTHEILRHGPRARSVALLSTRDVRTRHGCKVHTLIAINRATNLADGDGSRTKHPTLTFGRFPSTIKLRWDAMPGNFAVVSAQRGPTNYFESSLSHSWAGRCVSFDNLIFRDV